MPTPIINGGIATSQCSHRQQQLGSVVLGQGHAANETGTLEILSGGSLTVVDDGPQFPADGSVRVGQNVGQGFNAGTATPNANNAPARCVFCRAARSTRLVLARRQC